MAKATFAAGCFWGVEEAFRRVKGVTSTTVGYAGGTTQNPSYKDVCTGTTGHAEAVEVEFDPAQISYRELLVAFFRNHNPTTLNRQGPDFGTQYRSAIFYHDAEQEAAARESIAALEESGKYNHPIVTEIKPASAFYRAEEYHQQYLAKRGAPLLPPVIHPEVRKRPISMQQKMREDALRRYLVFRVKLIEFLDMAGLHELLRTNQLHPVTPVGRRPKDFTDSLQTVLLSWFALFVDKNGMNVIELWKELFPKRRDEIEKAWQRMKPAWDTLRRFRNKAGFHADKPRAFFNARREKLKNQAMIMQALAEFQKLQGAILKAESTELPDFPAAVDAFLDEQKSEGHQYNRVEFKRYLMIPETVAGPPTKSR